MCLSTGEGVPGQVPPRPGTSPWDQVQPQTRYTPQDQMHTGTRYTPQDRVHPPGTRYTHQTRYPLGPGTPPRTRYTPLDQVHPPLRRRLLLRMVCILLECILVIRNVQYLCSELLTGHFLLYLFATK